MLSVITVCYNSEKTIRKTIQSILNQTDSNIEHIFIDGNSGDDTVSIVNSYREDYESKGLRLAVVSEPDKGIYDAMNKGIGLATGTVIGILNSDDWYEPNTSAIVQKLMDKDPDTDILMGAVKIHNHEQNIVKKIKKSLWITSRNFNHPAMFVRKKCYEEVGSYDISMLYADFDWFLRAMKKGKKISYTGEILSNFSVGGVSNRKSLKQALYRIKDRYRAYHNNGYSRFYMGECILQEVAKYCLVRK